MNEQEWVVSTEPAAMLSHIQGKVSARKLRLFAVSCCRHPAVWPLLTDQRSRNAVEVAERFADGGATSVERGQAFNAADNLRNRLGAPEKTLAYAVLRSYALVGAEEIAMLTVAVESPFHGLPLAALLRATINPFALPLPAEVRTPLVVSLAEAAYNERRDDGTLDPERLAILSDALEEAGLPETVECWGCQGKGEVFRGLDQGGIRGRDGIWRSGYKRCGKCDETGRIPHPLLAALREPTPRWRGFWAVDMCLGRE